MSSHREAPEISKDPVADSADLYAFVSPDKPGHVTIIANYVPLQGPTPARTSSSSVTTCSTDSHLHPRRRPRRHHLRLPLPHRGVNPKTFLYNTGQITSIFDPHFNRRQTYSVTTMRGGNTVLLGANLAVPPCNIGPRSTPNYEHLAAQCVHCIGNRTFFAGQRADAFHVDLGSVFDLLDLRPFQNLHLIPTPAGTGVNSLTDLNVHSIAMRIPLSDLTVDGKTPTDVGEPEVGRRHLDDGEPTAHSRVRRPRRDSAERWRLGAGLPSRQPAGQRGRHPDGLEGRLEPQHALARLGLRRIFLHPEVCESSSRSSTRASSRTSLPTPSRAPTWSRSWVPASRRGSSPVSRTTPARWSRTCCA